MDAVYENINCDIRRSFNENQQISNKGYIGYKEFINIIFREKRITLKRFCEKADLSPATYYRFKNR
jgi:hypothetical protein